MTDDTNNWGLKVYSNFTKVFVAVNNLPKKWESATISIYDTRGARVHYSDLQYQKVNEINLNVHTGNYLVHVRINGIEFVN